MSLFLDLNSPKYEWFEIRDFVVYIHAATTLSPTDVEYMSQFHESFCEMTNVGQIVSRLYSRGVIVSKEMVQELSKRLKSDGSFAAASKWFTRVAFVSVNMST